MMNSKDLEISNLKLHLKEMEIRLDTVNAQNLRLNEENSNLRNQLNHLTKDYNLSSSMNVELQMRLHKIENDRDELNETLQIIRVRNNKIRSKHSDRNKRSAIIEDIRQNQNVTLTHEKNLNQKLQNAIPSATASDEEEKLRRQLNVAIQIINELEFELDDVEYLEAENQQLRSEINYLKEVAHGDDTTTASSSYSVPKHLPRLHQLYDSFEDEVDIRQTVENLNEQTKEKHLSTATENMTSSIDT